MDPQLRKLLEVSYEAWVDAGVDFSALRGSDRVGVYVGACGSETHAQWLGDIPSITGYEQTGCAQSMFPNRLSWWFDFRGPSKCIDTGELCIRADYALSYHEAGCGISMCCHNAGLQFLTGAVACASDWGYCLSLTLVHIEGSS